MKKYTYNKKYKKSKRLSRKKGGSAKRENDRFSKEIRDLEFEKEKFIRESEDYISASEKLSKALEYLRNERNKIVSNIKDIEERVLVPLYDDEEITEDMLDENLIELLILPLYDDTPRETLDIQLAIEDTLTIKNTEDILEKLKSQFEKNNNDFDKVYQTKEIIDDEIIKFLTTIQQINEQIEYYLSRQLLVM